MGVYPEEVELAESRDTQADADALIEEQSAKHDWGFQRKQGQSNCEDSLITL